MAYETTNPAGAKSKLDSGEGWVYLDVRSAPEFEAGHAPGSYNIPLLHKGARGMEPNAEFLDAVKRRNIVGTRGMQ